MKNKNIIKGKGINKNDSLNWGKDLPDWGEALPDWDIKNIDWGIDKTDKTLIDSITQKKENKKKC